ncbi:MAG: serine hydrolase domain-containing protein [Christensenellales bacterium]|jgi:CubicO group peptidase (beta-lactamase class C family)
MRFEPVKDFMDRLCAWRIPGNAIAIYQDNEIVFRYASGYADVEKCIPMRGDELVNIYSCTKVATVVAALQLYERGHFLLDDPLYEFLPEYRHVLVRDGMGGLRAPKSPITMRHLFTMTAGFDYNSDKEGFRKARELTNGHMDTVTVAKCMALDPLNFDPGTHFSYSLCHDVLAAAVEVISGKKFSQYIKETIFDPLDIATGTFHPTDAQLENAAQMYRFEEGASDGIQTGDGTGTWTPLGKRNTMIYGDCYESGGAGIVVGISDYAKFANALAMGGVGKTGERILSEGTVELLRTNQLDAQCLADFDWEQLRGYGYGLGVRTLIDIAKERFDRKPRRIWLVRRGGGDVPRRSRDEARHLLRPPHAEQPGGV